jgi:hypothetical protein
MDAGNGADRGGIFRGAASARKCGAAPDGGLAPCRRRPFPPVRADRREDGSSAWKPVSFSTMEPGTNNCNLTPPGGGNRFPDLGHARAAVVRGTPDRRADVGDFLRESVRSSVPYEGPPWAHSGVAEEARVTQITL